MSTFGNYPLVYVINLDQVNEFPVRLLSTSKCIKILLYGNQPFATDVSGRDEVEHYSVPLK